MVNWNNIRVHQGAQDQGFEELCCQLFRSQPPNSAKGFERRGYRDAGLECAYVLRDGTLRGMQAKFFTRAPSADEWGQVDRSVKTAIEKNPQLTHLTICIPQNFDDPKIPGQQSAMDKWKAHKASWEQLASTAGRQIEFELWGDTHLTDLLTRPESRGKLWYFFNQEELTPEWFRQRVEEAAQNAGVRYTKELNVELPISKLFDGLGRTARFASPAREQQGELNRLLPRLWANNLPPEADAILQEVKRLATVLRDTLEDSDLQGTSLLPLKKLAEVSSDLRRAAHEARSVLEEIGYKEKEQARVAWEAGGKQGRFNDQSPYSDLRSELWEVASAAHALSGFAEGYQAALANNPLLLVSGSAGQGKTHLFVDAAKQRVTAGLPALVFLGENFRDGVDPLAQIIQMLGLNLERDVFLQALEAAAEASHGRCLLLIDALNEGEGQRLWPKQLAGMISALSRYSRIGLALSVRTTYEEVVLPPKVQEAAVRVTHEGFASRPEVAARAFFAHYGLHLPNVPMLNPEFTNPLFLKLLCKGLRDEGLRDIPEGYEGITRVFAFLIQATDKKLRREGKIDVGPHEQPVQEYLNRLADSLAQSGEDALSFSEADRVSRAILPCQGYQGSLLSLLLAEGLLAREMLPGREGEARLEGVRFAYQRLGDHEIARRLLDQHCQEGVEPAFASEGGIGKLFVEHYQFYRHKGLLEALAIQVPERFGQEITALLPFSQEEPRLGSQKRVAAECLIESLLWRRKRTITQDTFAALKALDIDDTLYDRYLEVLLTLAAVPDHPLNAELLHGLLWRHPLHERDAFWTEWLHWHGAEGAADRLITWGLLPDEKRHLSDESVFLACVALAWLTVSTVHSVRDRATKALVRLLTPRPHLLEPLLQRFSDVDDTYLTERLYAAAYGVAMRLLDQEPLGRLAEAVYRQLFSTPLVVPHVLVRDYGRCVIERAVAYGCVLAFDVDKARPPYVSELPPEPPPREYFETLVKHDGEWTDWDRAISHVVDRFGSFDHSDYYGGPSFRYEKFTSIPLSETVPPSHKQIEDAWEESLTSEQLEIWELARRLRFSDMRINLSAYAMEVNEEEDIEAEPEIEDTASDSAEAAAGVTQDGEAKDETASGFEVAIAMLEDTLTPEQQDTLRNILLVPSDPAAGTLPLLGEDLFARYVVHRAIELGWTVERFASFDSLIERGKQRRGEHPYDTMGAKYLWMAYYEVYARLADHYHLLTEYSHKEAAPYGGSWLHDLRTIDPCLVPNEQLDSNGEPTLNEWWQPADARINDVREGHGEWLQQNNDLPSLENMLVTKDPEGVEWVNLEIYSNWKQEEKPEEARYNRVYRNLWLQVRGYLVRREEAPAILEWMKTQDFMGRWMPEGSEFHDIYLGEFHNSLAWRRVVTEPTWGYEEWRQPQRDCPGPFAHLQDEYVQPEEDAAPVHSCRVMLPSALLAREANLAWGGSGGEWLNEHDEIVVQDPSFMKSGSGALLIRRDFLDEFLSRRNYELVWTFLGEKLVINWDHRYPRLNITGGGHYTATKPEIFLQAEYKDSNADR